MTKESFSTWAVVELFGHQRIAGLVTEATIGGCAFVRVDVPEQPERPARANWDAGSPALPAYTRYFGQGAIYALNPCSEQIARRAAAEFRASPPIPFALPDISERQALAFAEDLDDTPLETGDPGF